MDTTYNPATKIAQSARSEALRSVFVWVMVALAMAAWGYYVYQTASMFEHADPLFFRPTMDFIDYFYLAFPVFFVAIAVFFGWVVLPALAHLLTAVLAVILVTRELIALRSDFLSRVTPVLLSPPRHSVLA